MLNLPHKLDLIMGGPAQKSEGLGTKIWPDGRVLAENKWPEFFWDGFGTNLAPFGLDPARKELSWSN